MCENNRELEGIELYFKDINNCLKKNKNVVLTEEEEKQLFIQLKEGTKEEKKQAKKKLIESNLKLVVKIANKYHGDSMELLDLIQEGNIGLMKAIDKFDVTRGLKFSTYAYEWINQSITRGMANNDKTIGVPADIYNLINAIKKFKKEYILIYGETPKLEDIEKKFNRIDSKKIKNAIKNSDECVSLNKLVVHEETGNETELLNILVSDYSMEDEAIQNLLLNEIMNCIKNSCLSEKEACIMNLRYGLLNGEEFTLKQISERFGISKERVRQILEMIKVKTQKSSALHELYLNDIPKVLIDNAKTNQKSLQKVKHKK